MSCAARVVWWDELHLSYLQILDPFAHLGHVHGAAKPVLLYFDSPWSTRAAKKDNYVLLAKSAPGHPGCWEPVLPPQLAARDTALPATHQAWAAAGLHPACGGHLLVASPPAAPGPGLSKNHHRKHHCFLRDTGGKEEYLFWKHSVIISEASLEKQTCSSFPFFQLWRVFLKQVLGLGGV